MEPSVVRTKRGARPWVLTALGAGLVLASIACGPPAPVVQGAVATVDGPTLGVIDETRPEAPPVVLDISQAEIGAPPAVGDVVRIVYRQEGGVNRALAVMNITRQEQNEGKAP